MNIRVDDIRKHNLEDVLSLERYAVRPIMGSEIMECVESGLRCKVVYSGQRVVAYSIANQGYREDVIHFYRLGIDPQLWSDWAPLMLSSIKSHCTGGSLENIRPPTVWCNVEDFRLAKELGKSGFIVIGEDYDPWGRLSYRFEVPLDDFPDKYIARQAEITKFLQE